MKKKILILVFIFLISCKIDNNKRKPITIPVIDSLVINKSIKKVRNWHHKDIEIDTIPGISLLRAYDSLLVSKKPKEVVVAVIDTEIDVNHEDLSGEFWVNENEILHNGIDDDNNGYIDDINGWNFIGNLNGENIIYSNLECVRLLQKYQSQFSGKENISYKDKANYKLYTSAKKYYADKLKVAKSDQEYGNFLFSGYPKAKKAMKKIFPKEDYTTKMLDSLYSKYKKSNTELANQAYFISDCIKYNLSEKWIYDYKKEVDNKIEKTYNLNYYDRKNIDNKPDDISFINYGNPYISKNMDEFYHGTLIAGLIGANRGNAIGINGITNNVKIMPLAISSNGEEHDKDIALAIRYAVDNGAEIINMSFGKNFSLYKEWVFEAIKYAEKSNVLIVSSAGNSSYNLNEYNNYYPNDNIENQEEVANNFLLVGSISNKLDNSFLSYYSNYGNIDVDIFAPGETIYTTLPNNKYKYDSGTSLASAITSGVAALLYAYYPNLTASQVKHILMDSGLEYDIEVSTPTKDDKNKMTPFNQLSKSGKVLNAYNAFIMADSISRSN
jgi:cell wall-associated protease